MRRRNRTALGLVLVATVLAITMVAAGMHQDGSALIDVAASRGDSDSVALGPNVFRDIAETVIPTVVNVRTESRRQTRDLTDVFGSDDLMERFFGRPQRPQQPREQIMRGAGTGFVVEDGLIPTNNHVVAGASKITVALYAEEDEEEEYDARIVGRDPLTDNALLELTEEPHRRLPVATLGRSDNVRPGDWAMAISNPFNLAHTVTVGVISAIGRPLPVSEGRW